MPGVEERSSSFLGIVSGGALSAKPVEQVRFLPLETIIPNGKQPRVSFENDKINQLALTIKENGLVQPITVRERDKSLTVRLEDPKYEIVAGERRWRAFQYLHSQGLQDFAKIPAFVRSIDDANMRKLALIENLEREDLGLLETAQAFVSLKKELGSADAIAATGLRSRSIVFKYLRIGEAEPKIIEIVKKHDLDLKKADLLLSILDNVQKQDDPKQMLRLEQELDSSTLSWDSLKALHTKYTDRNADATSNGIITTPQNAPAKKAAFWKTGNECGLNLKVKKSDLTTQRRHQIEKDIRSFLVHLGAKKVEIEL